ncbi:hypothetical protein N7I30_04925 [Aurantimonas litoralis]|nr:hypothetical protein [Aurantimonas litoralis]
MIIKPAQRSMAWSSADRMLRLPSRNLWLYLIDDPHGDPIAFAAFQCGLKHMLTEGMVEP